MGNFPIFPYRKCANDDINGCVYPKKERKTGYIKESVTASPGYFGLEMDTGVLVDMTVTHHASIFRFRFPGDNSSSPLLLLDLSDLSDTRQDNGTISVDPHTGRMMGHARFLPSFGSGSYVPYFCADFQGDAGLRDTGIFVNSRASTDVKNLTISRSVNGYPLPVCSPCPSHELSVSCTDEDTNPKGRRIRAIQRLRRPNDLSPSGPQLPEQREGLCQRRERNPRVQLRRNALGGREPVDEDDESDPSRQEGSQHVHAHELLQRDLSHDDQSSGLHQREPAME